MLRAISISVNARNRCTAEVTRLTQNHNRCCGLTTEGTAVRCGKSNRLGPPTGVEAVHKKVIDQRLIKFTGAYQVATHILASQSDRKLLANQRQIGPAIGR